MTAHPRRPVANPATSDAERVLLEALPSATRAFKHRLVAELERDHLTIPMFWALHELAADGAMSVGELASSCSVTAANISAAVQELAVAGLLERETAPNDRRVSLVKATEKGRTLHTAVWGRVVKQLAASLEGMPTAELDAAARVLGRLGSSIETHRPVAAPGARA